MNEWSWGNFVATDGCDARLVDITKRGARWQIDLMQGLSLYCAGRPVPLVSTSARLLTFLALHETPLQRSYVAGTLWPNCTQERSAASLRSALWRLRQCGDGLIDSDGRHIQLFYDVQVDYRQALACASQLLDFPSGHHGSHEKTIALLGRDLVPDCCDDEWLLVERERWRQLRLHALDVLCDKLASDGRHAAALQAALAAVRIEPLREAAHRALVKIHLTEGNRSEALRERDGYVDLLRRELGISPSALFHEMLDFGSTMAAFSS